MYGGTQAYVSNEGIFDRSSEVRAGSGQNEPIEQVARRFAGSRAWVVTPFSRVAFLAGTGNIARRFQTSGCTLRTLGEAGLMLKTVWLLSAIALYGLLVLISPYLGLAFGRFVVTAVLLAPPGVSAFVLARSLWKGLSRRGAPPPVAPGRPAVVLFRIGFLIAGGVLVAVSLNARMHLLQQSRQAHADARGQVRLLTIVQAVRAYCLQHNAWPPSIQVLIQSNLLQLDRLLPDDKALSQSLSSLPESTQSEAQIEEALGVVYLGAGLPLRADPSTILVHTRSPNAFGYYFAGYADGSVRSLDETAFGAARIDDARQRLKEEMARNMRSTAAAPFQPSR
jgi:hypothetical protein